MKESLENKYLDKTITEEELGKYKKSLWVKKGILSGIYLFMMIFSFIYIKRIGVFFNALGGGRFSFYLVAIVIFYITLSLAFGYFLFQIGYMIYSEMKGLDWVALITKLNIKLDIYSFICKCLSILLFIMIYITTPCTVVGSSMDPTFKDGDRLLCTDLFYTPKRDDIIVFDAKNYTDLDSFFIKRTIAIEGDIIKLSGPDMNEVSINNQVYSDISKDEFIRIRKSAGIMDDTETSFLIPSGMQLVMGDNRDNSHDSRKFGLIKNEDVFGRVYMRVFPFTGIHFY